MHFLYVKLIFDFFLYKFNLTFCINLIKDRYKWGVGRMVIESKVKSTFVPNVFFIEYTINFYLQHYYT